MNSELAGGAGVPLRIPALLSRPSPTRRWLILRAFLTVCMEPKKDRKKCVKYLTILRGCIYIVARLVKLSGPESAVSYVQA